MNTSREKRVSTLWPCFLVLLQGLLYGFGDPISKRAYEKVSVYALLSVRYAIALVVLLLFAGRRILRGLRNCRVRDWLPASLCIAGAYLVGNIGLGLTAATSVAFLRSMSTVLTPILGFVMFRKKPGLCHVPVRLLSLVGMYLLCGKGELARFGLGEVCALACAILLAGSLVFGEKALDRVEPLALTAVQVAASTVLATAFALVFDGGIHLESASPVTWGIIVYLAILCTLAGYLLQNKALCSISSRTVALLQCFCPVMTAVFSFVLLGERLSPAGMAGAVILLGCVVAETWMKEET